MKKISLISGITGQTGSYLAELLLKKGYEVHGIIRRNSTFNTDRIDHIFDKLKLHYGDMTDGSNLSHIVDKVEPDEVYNLAAQSHVKISFDMPIFTVNVGGLGTLRLLEAIKDYQEHSEKKVKMYHAGTSEMFGASPPPQNEQTPFHPRSPYACAKVYSHLQCINYREAYDMFICNGILFNHEGVRRTPNFVTRKITIAASRIKLGLQNKLELGNLDALRDWGNAAEYAYAIWLMLQANSPDDYVVATGESHTIKDFVKEAFGLLNLDWKKYVVINPKYFRPTEVNHLCGDASKIKQELDWEPKTKFKDLVKLMVKHDLTLAKKEAHMKNFKD